MSLRQELHFGFAFPIRTAEFRRDAAVGRIHLVLFLVHIDILAQHDVEGRVDLVVIVHRMDR